MKNKDIMNSNTEQMDYFIKKTVIVEIHVENVRYMYF